jgi:hypothetical protein
MKSSVGKANYLSLDYIRANGPTMAVSAAVAQWIEYWPPKPRVVGSIPASRTKVCNPLNLNPVTLFREPKLPNLDELVRKYALAHPRRGIDGDGRDLRKPGLPAGMGRVETASFNLQNLFESVEDDRRPQGKTEKAIISKG